MFETWQWQIFLKDTGGGQTYLSWLLSAWGWTLSVSFCALIIAMLTGVVIGVMRTLPNPWISGIGQVWTELFRNIPLLVQIFLWYYAIPMLVPALKSAPSFLLVVMAIGLYTSSRIAEQVRAGIQALPKGQRYAAMALGLSTAQSYRWVLMPVALRIVIPPLTSESMNIVKNSSVAFAVSISELTMFAMQAQEETSRGIEVYLAVTGLYFLSSFAVNRFASLIESRVQIPGLLGAAR